MVPPFLPPRARRHVWDMQSHVFRPRLAENVFCDFDWCWGSGQSPRRVPLAVGRSLIPYIARTCSIETALLTPFRLIHTRSIYRRLQVRQGRVPSLGGPLEPLDILSVRLIAD
jgi:hypothetical protein